MCRRHLVRQNTGQKEWKIVRIVGRFTRNEWCLFMYNFICRLFLIPLQQHKHFLIDGLDVTEVLTHYWMFVCEPYRADTRVVLSCLSLRYSFSICMLPWLQCVCCTEHKQPQQCSCIWMWLTQEGLIPTCFKICVYIHLTNKHCLHSASTSLYSQNRKWYLGWTTCTGEVSTSVNGKLFVTIELTLEVIYYLSVIYSNRSCSESGGIAVKIQSCY